MNKNRVCIVMIFIVIVLAGIAIFRIQTRENREDVDIAMFIEELNSSKFFLHEFI